MEGAKTQKNYQTLASLSFIFSLLLDFGCKFKTGGDLTMRPSPKPSSYPLVESPSIFSPSPNPIYSKDSSLLIMGNCMTEDTVYINGDAEGETLCKDSVFSFVVEKKQDGVYSFLVTQKKVLGQNNTSSDPVSLVWIRKTSVSPPVILTPSLNPYASAVEELEISGKCENGAEVSLGVGTNVIEPVKHTTCENSSFGLSLPKSSDGDYLIQITQTDLAGNSASAHLKWLKHALSAIPNEPSLVVGTEQAFTFSGGTGLYTLSLITNPSGGTLDAVNQVYTAGTQASLPSSLPDMLKVTDSQGFAKTIRVHTVSDIVDHLIISSGNRQIQTMGEILHAPIRVRVVDRYGNPAASTQLLFRTVAGDARVLSSPVRFSDQNGYAEVFLQMGFSSLLSTVRVSHYLNSAPASFPDLAKSGGTAVTFTETLSSLGSGLFGFLFPTGSLLSAFLALDFDGDGKKDLAVVNSGDSSVGILMGKGNGLFGAMAIYLTCDGPSAIGSGDYNGDGKSDLVVTCKSSNALSILLGNGDGSFQIHQDFQSVNSPAAMVVQDFQGNGTGVTNDLAVISSMDDIVALYFSNGDGTLRDGPQYATGRSPNAIVARDINADGKPDLVISNSGDSSVSVLINTGNGTFQPKVDFSTGLGPVSIAIDDIDRDGKQDVAVANSTENSVSILLGNGDGTLRPKTDIPTGINPTSVLLLDFEGEGNLDLAISHGGDSTLSIFKNSGGVSFSRTTDYQVGSGPVSVIASDVNGDGTQDLLVASSDSQSVQIFPNKSDGTFGLRFPAGLTPVALVIEDFDQDGKKDLAVVNSVSATISLLQGKGNGLFQPFQGVKKDLNTGANPVAIIAHDFNGDRKLDLAVASHDNGSVGVFLGNGDGTFSARIDSHAGNGPSGLCSGYFNGDEIPDLAVSNSGNSTMTILLGIPGVVNNESQNPDLIKSGSGSFRSKEVSTGAAPLAVVSSDFNGDGVGDIATANSNDNSISVFLGNGDGAFQARVDYITGSGPNSLVVGDFNGDEILDLAVTNSADGTLSMLIGSGDGSFGPKMDYSVDGTPGAFVSGDFNGDGRLDLAIVHGRTGLMSVLIGLGTGSFASPVAYSTGFTFSGIATSDLNSDGTIDLVTTDSDNNSVQIWIGQ